jgi:hypothetical protein
MKVLAIDKMMAVYLITQLVEDFQNVKPGHTVAFICRDSRFREMLEHWLKCRYKDDTIKVTRKDEFDSGVDFYLEILDDECPTKFALRLLQGNEFLVTLLGD